MVHTPSPPPQQPSPDRVQPSFLRLPAEIRLQIYSLLVLPQRKSDLRPDLHKVRRSLQDSFDYEKFDYENRQRGTDRTLHSDIHKQTLLIRTIDGEAYSQRYEQDNSRGPHLRRKYGVNGRFRVRFFESTYHCVNNPRLEGNTGLMCANRQIHAEMAELLYSSYTFDFDTHVEAISPFFSDLTPYARSCVKNVRFVKRGLAYDREYDRYEWTNAMRFLTAPNSSISLRRLELGVVAGKPGLNGWDRIAAYSASDFNRLRDTEGMQWLQYVLEIKGLQDLDVTAIVEHCPPATNSMAMAAFIRFSASVESGFSKYMKQMMLPV